MTSDLSWKCPAGKPPAQRIIISSCESVQCHLWCVSELGVRCRADYLRPPPTPSPWGLTGARQSARTRLLPAERSVSLCRCCPPQTQIPLGRRGRARRASRTRPESDGTERTRTEQRHKWHSWQGLSSRSFFSFLGFLLSVLLQGYTPQMKVSESALRVRVPPWPRVPGPQSAEPRSSFTQRIYLFNRNKKWYLVRSGRTGLSWFFTTAWERKLCVNLWLQSSILSEKEKKYLPEKTAHKRIL